MRIFLTSSLLIVCTPGAVAADYPTRPIRLIVPFTAASAADLLARMIGTKLTESWGQQTVVDNRPSAGGTVAGAIVATAAPDGHTLMVTSSAFAGSAALYDKLPYDPIKDFSGITQIAVTPTLLVVGPNLGAKSVKELIALAQQKPGQLTYGSAGIGSGTHFAAEFFNMTAGIKTVHVPYRGSPEALTDTMSGRIHYSMSPMLTAVPLIRSGRVFAIGVTSPQRVPALPDVPTIAEAALPGFAYEGWFGVLAPSRTPRALVTRLSHEIGRIIMLPENQERISRDGSTARASTPEQFEKLVRDEIVTRRKVFKAAGVKPD
ncbi:MAG TPA: tripartite tricarboxylate transporter substrate binding protein [Burkholderiales bacterium]|nr:tripartite tricarboxylate transporter substrate binding protein [Burkholderiales bacterium]